MAEANYARDRERIRAYNRAYYIANRERLIANARACKDRNPERTKAARADLYQRNKKRVAEQTRRWCEENPERAREISQKRSLTRRARVRAAFVEPVDPVLVYARDRGLCGLCGLPVSPADFHVDHIVPLARGGEHSYANTQPAHPFCNKSKGGRILA